MIVAWALVASVLAIVLATVVTLGVLRVRRERTGRKKLAGELRQSRQHLKNKMRALEAANRELESFSYSVSHDLRSPLRAVGSYTQMLEEDFGAQLPAEAQRYIAVIRESAERMERLISDLLSFAGLGRSPVRIEELDPRYGVARARQEVLHGHKGVEPHIVVHDLPMAQGDST